MVDANAAVGELTGEIEVLGENMSQYHFVHHNPYMTYSGTEPGPTRWQSGD
jgi:hypothetical protein